MILLTLGLAEGMRRHNVAVSSFWPNTIIQSQASINHRLGTPEMWQKPEILVDCVLRPAGSLSTEVTGRALLDEDFLWAEVVDMLAGEYPDVAFMVPHLGSFADDWRVYQRVIDQLVRFPNVFADTSGVRQFDYLVQAVRRAGEADLRVRRTVAAPRA